MDSPPMLIAIAGAFLMAGLVKGVIGMGMPTVAIGLLGLMTTPAQAAAILVIPSLVTNIWQMAVGGRLVNLLKRLWPLLSGTCAGTFVGAIVLPHGGGPQATIWLGVALAVYAVLGLLKIEFAVPPRAEAWLGLIVGVITGVITVATGVFAMPGVPYIQSLRMDRHELVQALGLSFMVSTSALALALSHAGTFNSGVVVPSLVALALALAGMWVGKRLRGRIEPQTFRLFFFIGLFGLGASLALRGLH